MLEQDDNGVYTEELINGTRRPLDAFDAQGDVMQEVTKEYADRFLAAYRKQVAGRSERSENRAYCAGGEGSGIDPSCGSGGGGGSTGSSGTDYKPSTAWSAGLPKEQAKAVEGWMYKDYEAIRDIQYIEDKFPERYVRDKFDKAMFDATVSWNKAMESAPVFEGVAYRGINPYTNTEGFRPEEYKVGDVITFSSDSSATSDPAVAKRFSEVPTTIDYEDQGYGTTFEPKPGVVLKIHTRTAADIRGANPREQEVIIRRRSQYVVESVTGNEVTLKPK